MRIFSIYFLFFYSYRLINILVVTSFKIYRNYEMNNMEPNVFNSVSYLSFVKDIWNTLAEMYFLAKNVSCIYELLSKYLLLPIRL